MRILLNKAQVNRIIENYNNSKNIIKEDTGGLFSKLPPGFSQDDFLSPEQACGAQEEVTEENPTLDDLKFAAQSRVDSLLKRRAAGEKHRKGDPILHSSIVSKVVDENGVEIDKEKLKALFSIRPTRIINDTNNKLLKLNTVAITMPTFMGLMHDETDNVLRIVNTCPNAKDCVFSCYTLKGHYTMYDASSKKSCQSLTYLFNDYMGWKNQVLGELEEILYKIERPILRWHDAGDFMSRKYLDIAIDIARMTPDVQHYAYTKEVSLLKSAKLPPNFEITFSEGGKEDMLIDKTKERYSTIIYNQPDKNKKAKIIIDFKKYYDQKKIGKGKDTSIIWVPKSDEHIKEFKKELSKEAGLELDSVLTLRELLRVPDKQERIYNVIVTPSDSDAAAIRKDVLGIFLLYH
jgi:hypothetical protein